MRGGLDSLSIEGGLGKKERGGVFFLVGGGGGRGHHGRDSLPLLANL